MRLAKTATKPVVLADIQDNPGAGGTSDTVGLLRALIAHEAGGAVIGMIVDPEAAEAATAAGEGRGAAAAASAPRWAMPARRRSRPRGGSCGSASGVFTGSGPMYGGAKFRHRPDGAGHRRGERRLGGARVPPHPGGRPGDVPPCRGRAVRRCRSSRSNRRSISARIFSRSPRPSSACNPPGAHVTDPVELPYRNLRKGIRLRPQGPVHG